MRPGPGNRGVLSSNLKAAAVTSESLGTVPPRTGPGRDSESDLDAHSCLGALKLTCKSIKLAPTSSLCLVYMPT